MAKETIKGRNVAFYLEKTAGSGTYDRYACTDDVSLEITTESIETSACDEDEEGEVSNFKSFEPGDITWTGSASGNPRKITGADATTNISVEEMIDMQLAGRKFLMRYSLGNNTVVGTARYGGQVFITQNSVGGTRTEAATHSVNFQGSGALTKTLVTA